MCILAHGIFTPTFWEKHYHYPHSTEKWQPKELPQATELVSGRTESHSLTSSRVCCLNQVLTLHCPFQRGHSKAQQVSSLNPPNQPEVATSTGAGVGSSWTACCAAAISFLNRFQKSGWRAQLLSLRGCHPRTARWRQSICGARCSLGGLGSFSPHNYKYSS